MVSANKFILVFAGAVSVATAYSGDATYYTPGVGACGQTHSDSDSIVALAAVHFDNANPNLASACGKSIKVDRNGKSVVATVVDKCPTCDEGSVDLSPSAFQQIADTAEGRVQVDWTFV